ncbi:hypothetical protein AXF42_Ash003882 [Apostasia shenzhenica]|uniref:Uncharacterized protein n=1 Tax=Apostasia shenzhenica TaxID=1088818 RepID=A0A2I0AI90_9ASPA|nr:hypothetical protein AXF42_Ash003882 [Apostasia shenzhenica]
MEFPLESPRRRSSASSSPEFEFWMLTNPASSEPNPQLLSADELFAGGVLLPLHLLSLTPAPAASGGGGGSPLIPPPPPPAPPPATETEDPPPSPPPPSSKKWKTIFKSGEKKSDKKDRKASSNAAAAAAAAAELNIHIWPFSRSRSAGNGRPRAVGGGGGGGGGGIRKTSSAPCSRSNSSGEPAAGPAGAAATAAVAGRRTGGIYLGRASPVWQLRRRGGAVAGGRRDVASAGGRVLNLNANTCIGHRKPENCRGCDNDAATADVTGDQSGDGDGGAGGRGPGGRVTGSLFNLKAIFAKKVY